MSVLIGPAASLMARGALSMQFSSAIRSSLGVLNGGNSEGARDSSSYSPSCFHRVIQSSSSSSRTTSRTTWMIRRAFLELPYQVNPSIEELDSAVIAYVSSPCGANQRQELY